MMPSSRNDRPPRLLTISTTEEPIGRCDTLVRLSGPLYPGRRKGWETEGMIAPYQPSQAHGTHWKSWSCGRA